MATIVNSALVGLEHLVYAKITKDDATGTTYDVVKEIAPVIDAKISPKVNSNMLYANNMAVANMSIMSEIEVEFQISDLPIEVYADLLGHTYDSTKGVVESSAQDIAPYIAIGFKAKKENGKYRYVWLLKGRFEEVNEEYKTMSDKVDFATPSIKGTFFARLSDKKWKYVADEDAGYTGGDNWFTAVAVPTTTV